MEVYNESTGKIEIHLYPKGYEPIKVEDMTDDYEKFFDDHCDYCKTRQKKNCGDSLDCKEGYDFLDCCEDNLKKNVAEICWKYNVSQNVAVAIIKILEKERERNELMYVHREYLLERGFETDTDNGSAEIQRSGERNT